MLCEETETCFSQRARLDTISIVYSSCARDILRQRIPDKAADRLGPRHVLDLGVYTTRRLKPGNSVVMRYFGTALDQVPIPPRLDTE